MKSKRKQDKTLKGPKRQKKITVKFFLNKAVQPLIEGRIRRYPLYMLITYNRKNTMMKSLYANNYYRDMKEVELNHYPGILSFEEKIIKKSIMFELDRQGEKFDMKGVYKKYQYYSKGIHVLLAQTLKNQLWSILMRLEPFEYARAFNFSDPDVEFDILFAMAKKVYKNFEDLLSDNFMQQIEIYQGFIKVYRGSFVQYSFPTVIDWLDKSGIEEFNKKMQTVFKDKDELVNKSRLLINKIILDNLTLA